MEQTLKVFYVSEDEEIIKRLAAGWHWQVGEQRGGPFLEIQEALDDLENQGYIEQLTKGE